MPSPALLSLLRRGCSAIARRPLLMGGRSPEAPTAAALVGGKSIGMVGGASIDVVGGASIDVVGAQRLSESVPLNSDGGHRPTWNSLGIWDRTEEPDPLLPSRVRRVIHQVRLSQVGCASVLGLRKQNEDRLRFSRIHDNLLYFAVFDGHGGPHAADYCYTFMEKFIRDALEEENDLENVLKKAFLDADKALHTHLSYFNNASFLTAGTTATVAMLRDGVELVVGSVGDSRAMVCRSGRATMLTKDHTPEQEEERLRIQDCGGVVTWNSVGQANVNGRLAMTRSIGDFHVKTSGVIAEPDTQGLTVQHASDSFLALTTDGINFLLSDQEICDVISQCQDPAEAADVITQQALQFGSEDNASIMVVPLGAWGEHRGPTVAYSMSRSFASSGRWA